MTDQLKDQIARLRAYRQLHLSMLDGDEEEQLARIREIRSLGHDINAEQVEGNRTVLNWLRGMPRSEHLECIRRSYETERSMLARQTQDRPQAEKGAEDAAKLP